MADPLSQLRQFHINRREIKEHGDYIIFGDHGWPKTVNTNYLVYKTEEDKGKKEYYTLECLLYFLKNMDVAHHHYVRQAGCAKKPVVHRPDRKDLLAYLKGEQQTAASIDKNAPIPPLRLPTSEIYKKDNNASNYQSQPSTSSRAPGTQNQHDADRSESGSAKKRPHDPEMERKYREEFAARLYEPSSKKLATIIPTETVEKSGESAEGSAAISKFGAEKLAAMRAKHLAVKRTTIIDADSEVGKPGSGVANPNRKEDVLYAVDSDKYQLIKSKEKQWRTRSTILQSQSKNFVKTVLPMINLLMKMDDPKAKSQNHQMPPVPVDMQMNPYSQQQQQQQQQQQAIQRNTYNRYDQERFVKVDIGVEIDTNKSFVGGVTNGLPNYNQGQQTRPVQPNPTNIMAPLGNGSIGRVSGPENRYKTHTTPQARPHKRLSTVPIIVIPATTTSLINMRNAQTILQDLSYAEESPGGRPRESEVLIQRKRPDGTHAPYKILDNPLKLDPEDWNRVVAVFVQGPGWQFKNWPWNGSPVDIFSHIKGFHLKWDETKLDDNVAKWNVHILELSRNKRHLDRANLLKFWSSLDTFMMKHKSFLKF